MKFLTLMLYLGFVLISNLSSAESVEDNSGSVYGYVFNGSKSDHSKSSQKKFGVAGQEVVLYSYIDGQVVEGARPHTVTGSNGRFEFTGLEVGKRFAYYPVAVFEGIEYYGEIVALTPDSVQKRSDVLIFESTHSDSAISAVTHHVIIKPGIGVLGVREVYFFKNRGRHTYVGNTPAGPPDKNIVLTIDVPDNATEMQFGGDLMSCCAVVSGHYIFDTMEFKPGMRQIVLNYLLPYKGKAADLVKEITHHTATMDVFLPQGSGTLSAPQFTAHPAFEIRGLKYQRYRAANLEKGSMLTLAISELPATAPDLRWLAPVILVGFIIVVYGAHRWHKSNSLSRKSSKGAWQDSANANERQRILNEILQLDEAYEAGNLDESTYLTAREKLIQLVLELEGEDQNTDTAALKKQEIEKP
ncbi:MAG: hypothetical protein ACE5NG_07790 [bacterium]